MKFRTRLVVALASVALVVGFAPSVYANPDDSDFSGGDITILGWTDYSNRCTRVWDAVPGEGSTPFAVCMRLFYVDHGNTVTLKKIKIYMTNVMREDYGYYFDVTYVRCDRGSGQTDWFFTKSNKVFISSDAQDYPINPPNMDCGEGNVVFGGNGIINQHLAPDLNDEFGNSSGNHIPTD